MNNIGIFFSNSLSLFINALIQKQKKANEKKKKPFYKIFPLHSIFQEHHIQKTHPRDAQFLFCRSIPQKRMLGHYCCCCCCCCCCYYSYSYSYYCYFDFVLPYCFYCLGFLHRNVTGISKKISHLFP